MNGAGIEVADRAPEALTEALADSNTEARYAAALALGDLGTAARPATSALIEALQHDRESLVRQASAIALGKIGAEEATDALLRALREDCADVRFQIPAALSAVAPAQRAGPALIPALADRDVEVRVAAAAALGDLRYAAAAEPLANALNDPSEDVRFEATLALARLDDDRGRHQLGGFVRHPEHRLAVAHQLFHSPVAELRPTLVGEIQRWRTPPLVRVWLAGALARLGDPLGEQLLRKLARSRHPPVRGLAREVLDQL